MSFLSFIPTLLHSLRPSASPLTLPTPPAVQHRARKAAPCLPPASAPRSPAAQPRFKALREPAPRQRRKQPPSATPRRSARGSALPLPAARRVHTAPRRRPPGFLRLSPLDFRPSSGRPFASGRGRAGSRPRGSQLDAFFLFVLFSFPLPSPLSLKRSPGPIPDAVSDGDPPGSPPPHAHGARREAPGAPSAAPRLTAATAAAGGGGEEGGGRRRGDEKKRRETRDSPSFSARAECRSTARVRRRAAAPQPPH